MNIMNKKIALPVLTLALLAGVTTFGVNKVYAQENGFGHAEEFANRFAERFGLNTDEVNSFMNEFHEERMQERHQEQIDRLATLVDGGELTQEEADMITAKWEEMRSEGSVGDHRDEFRAWAEENGIDLSVLRPEGHRGHGMGGPKQ